MCNSSEVVCRPRNATQVASDLGKEFVKKHGRIPNYSERCEIVRTIVGFETYLPQHCINLHGELYTSAYWFLESQKRKERVLQTKALQDCNVPGTEWETLEQGDSLTIRLVMRLMRSPYLSCMVARDSESKAWDWDFNDATHVIRILPH